MDKLFKAEWCSIWLFVIILAGCQGHDKISSETLMLTISTQNENWEVVSSQRINQPYYTSSANAPIYQADMLDGSGHVIQKVFFGKEFFAGSGNEFKLPFPELKRAQQIIVYRLDSSSGHITNKNRDKVLDWRIGV